jgi:hypothetical protein
LHSVGALVGQSSTQPYVPPSPSEQYGVAAGQVTLQPPQFEDVEIAVSHPLLGLPSQLSKPGLHAPSAHAPALHVLAAFSNAQGAQLAAAQPVAGADVDTQELPHAFSFEGHAGAASGSPESPPPWEASVSSCASAPLASRVASLAASPGSSTPGPPSGGATITDPPSRPFALPPSSDATLASPGTPASKGALQALSDTSARKETAGTENRWIT